MSVRNLLWAILNMLGKLTHGSSKQVLSLAGWCIAITRFQSSLATEAGSPQSVTMTHVFLTTGDEALERRGADKTTLLNAKRCTADCDDYVPCPSTIHRDGSPDFSLCGCAGVGISLWNSTCHYLIKRGRAAIRISQKKTSYPGYPSLILAYNHFSPTVR
jgi:hypothetical protein